MTAMGLSCGRDDIRARSGQRRATDLKEEKVSARYVRTYVEAGEAEAARPALQSCSAASWSLRG